MKLKVPSLKFKVQGSRLERGFTMVEIAIAIGVIGFALVAIVGILPRGLTVQKDNREEMTISQDGPYFLNAICTGQQGLDDLTNYVDAITWTCVNSNGVTVFKNNYSAAASGGDTNLWNGQIIIGLLSTVKYTNNPVDGLRTNTIQARIHSVNSAATMQHGANKLVAFHYLLTSDVVPFVDTNHFAGLPAPISTNVGTLDYMISTNRQAETARLIPLLYEVHLRFQWPLLNPEDPTDVRVGDGLRHFRAMVSSQAYGGSTIPGLTFFRPQQYAPPTTP